MDSQCRSHLKELLWLLKKPTDAHAVYRHIVDMSLYRYQLQHPHNKTVLEIYLLWIGCLNRYYTYDPYLRTPADRCYEDNISASDNDLLDDVLISNLSLSYRLVLSTFPLYIRLCHQLVIDPIMRLQDKWKK